MTIEIMVQVCARLSSQNCFFVASSSFKKTMHKAFQKTLYHKHYKLFLEKQLVFKEKAVERIV